MNNLDKIYQEKGLNGEAFSKAYADYLTTLLSQLDSAPI